MSNLIHLALLSHLCHKNEWTKVGRDLPAAMGNLSESAEWKEINLWAVEISILQLRKIPMSHVSEAMAGHASNGKICTSTYCVGIFLLFSIFQQKSVTSFSFCERDAATPTGPHKIAKTGFPWLEAVRGNEILCFVLYSEVTEGEDGLTTS